MSFISKTFHSPKRLIRVVTWILAVGITYYLFCIVLVWLTNHPKAPNVTYSHGYADCSGVNQDHCDIQITVTNPTDDIAKLEYIDTGGGPIGGVILRMKIYAVDGKFCYAAPVPRTGYFDKVASHQSKVFTLRCMSGQKQDETVDTRPSYVEVDYYGKKDRINLDLKNSK